MNQRVNPALAWPLECRVSLSLPTWRGQVTWAAHCWPLPAHLAFHHPSLPPPLPGQNLVSIIQGEIFGMTHWHFMLLFGMTLTFKISRFILAYDHWITDLRVCVGRCCLAACNELYWVISPRWPECLVWDGDLDQSSIVECGPRGSDQNVDWAGVTIYNVICIQTS